MHSNINVYISLDRQSITELCATKTAHIRGYHEWLSYLHKELNNTDTHHILYKNYIYYIENVSYPHRQFAQSQESSRKVKYFMDFYMCKLDCFCGTSLNGILM